jgi:hypothetical protein
VPITHQSVGSTNIETHTKRNKTSEISEMTLRLPFHQPFALLLGGSSRNNIFARRCHPTATVLPKFGDELHAHTKRSLISSKTSSSDKGGTAGDDSSDSSRKTNVLHRSSRKNFRGKPPQVERRFKKLRQKEWKQHEPSFPSTDDNVGPSSSAKRSHLFESNFIRPTPYLYSPMPNISSLSSSSLSSSSSSPSENFQRHVLYSIDTSPFLEQARYCKQMRGTSQPYRDASRTIDGTSAARRLLRGKKNLTNEMRDWLCPSPSSSSSPSLPTTTTSSLSSQSPSSPSFTSSGIHGRRHPRRMSRQFLSLEGHGVPTDLFQHFVDMGYALLQYYGDDIESCSFHNFYNLDDVSDLRYGNNNNNEASSSGLQNRPNPEDVTVYKRLIPHQVVTRGQNGAILSCVKPPGHGSSIMTSTGASNNEWDHQLALYLTVKERLVRELGSIMDRAIGRSRQSSCSARSWRENGRHRGEEETKRHSSKTQPSPIQDYDYDRDDEDVASSAHLFPPSNCWEQPRWSVDILRRKELILEPLSDTGRGDNTTTVSFSAANEDDNNDVAPFPIIEFVPPPADRNQSSVPPIASSRHVMIRLQGCAKPNGSFPDVDFDTGRPLSHRYVTLVFHACPSSGSI